uniref:Cadherin domain-containing protein n=1 Tax=Amphimedon queenslandica TaxID=400682 RepID=A0A1X7TAH9_AMPQE
MAKPWLVLRLFELLSLAVLILLLLVASNEGATGGGVCTEGFMDLSLLVAKAAPVTPSTVNPFADNNARRWIISYKSFNCSTAAVTEVFLGVDIRSKDGNRNKYLNIDIWQYNDNNYRYQNPVPIPIVLSPDNVTTNGLYRYVLPTPFSVSGSNYDTYRLGVYQPEDDSSVVRLYRARTSSTETVGRIRADSISESNIRITGDNREIDFDDDVTNIFMVHLRTNPPYCFENVFTEAEINTNSLSVTNVIPVNDTRAFPNIRFTCNGIITNWIIGITQNQDTSKHYPNIYLKRSSKLIYALTVDASAATSSNGNVYNFTSDIEVEYGDMLVINVTTNSNPMYYQQYNGPLNYELDSSNGLIPLEHNDYPLISVIINPISSGTSTTFSKEMDTVATMTILQSSSTVMTNNYIPNSFTSLRDTTLLSTTNFLLTIASVNLNSPSPSSSITDSSVTRSSGPTVGNAGGGNSASMIAAVATTILVLLIISIIVILILIVIVYKKRNKASHISEGRDAFLASSVYSDVTPNGKGENEIHDMCNPNYQAQGAADVYEVPMPVMKGIEAVYGDTMTDVSNPNYEDPNEKSSVPLLYEEPIATLTKKQNDTEFSNELYGLLEEATLYVPTALERSGEQSEEIYSALIHEQ